MNKQPEQADTYSSRLLDAHALRALDAAQWDMLSATALVENPFYSRQYVLAGLDTIDRGAGVRAIAIHDQHGRLAGLFPYRQRYRPPFPWPIALGAENLYQFSGTPLVARENASAVIDAWLGTLQGRAVPGFWTLPNFDLESRLAPLLATALEARDMQMKAIITYPRPFLTRMDGGLEAHARDVIPKRRLKDIQRNLRRLREMGELTFERASDGAQVRQRLEQFLTTEQAGWKGEGGTAFLSNADDAAFARRAFGGHEAAEGLTSIDSLLLDGKPIAMSINIASGSTAFTPKCAYDETLRKHSPGLVLEYLVIERFYEAGEFIDMDASTTTGGHVVLGLWNNEKRMARVIIGPDDWRTGMLAKGWEAFHERKQDIKRLIGRED